jgi:ribosomal-protein-alanine N-acetyltransferase
MMGLPFFRRETPALEGERVRLRMPRASDYHEWASVRRESAEFLQPWEPRWAPDELERGAWRSRVRRYRQEFAQGSAIAFLIFEKSQGRMLGGITVGNIRYGVSQSAQIGYWMGERHAGQGYMQDAMRAVLDFCFDRMRLHRIEAACIPGNMRSARVLEKAGFQREALLRSYLRIDGVWQDHVLYALIADDYLANRKRGRNLGG